MKTILMSIKAKHNRNIESGLKKSELRLKPHAERCYDWAVAKIVSAEVGNVLDVLLKEYEQ